MGAVVVLQGADNLRVEPGQSVTAQLSVANNGTIVEQFTVMVVGDAQAWIHSDPPVVSLFPGGQQTVTLRFAPPRDYTTPSGPVDFGVKVIPSNEPDESVTEEGVITVGSFTDVGAELVPRVATGRFAGHQKLAVDSRGNVPLPVVVTAVDSADALKFGIRPEKLTTAPGEARFIRLRVKPRQRFWKGPNQQKPYKVHVAPENEKPLVLDGALTQKAVFPKWLLPLLGVLAALALLWFLLLRPIVHNDAVNASKAAIKAQAAQTQRLAGAVAAASQAAKQANSEAAAAAALAGHKPLPTTTTSTTTTTVAKKVVIAAKPTASTTTTSSTTTTTTAVTPTTQPPPFTGPNDGRIEVIAAPRSAASQSITVAHQSTLQITDLVIENVSGSSGQASVQRVPAGSQTGEKLIEENLNTLTDQEYHFQTPIVLTSQQQLVLSVSCLPNQPACDVFIYFTGPITEPQSDTTTTAP
jgi:hypothetical protein